MSAIHRMPLATGLPALAAISFPVLAILAALPAPARADVTLAAPFSDHMVLQRGIAVPVWGNAGAGEQVTVTFRGQSRNVAAGTDGKWLVRLDATAQGGPFELVVADQGKNTVTLTDVLVGEVWLAGGQSNMEYTMGPLGGPNADSVKVADFPNLRIMNYRGNGKWSACTPTTVKDFSTTAYYFGRDLQQALNIPVGIVASAVGGTPVEGWMDPATLAVDPLLSTDTAAGNLYKKWTAPLVPMAMKGVIWYQGEANTGTPPYPTYPHYRGRIQSMIEGWRKVWGQGDFPFYFVQLANYQAAQTDPGEGGGWAEVRESQRLDLSVKNTAMAVTIDIGEAADIHPKNKWDVGKRLALPALALLYGQSNLVWSGPLYKSMRIQGNTVRLGFGYAEGLMAKGGGKLTGFAIAGADNKWSWADASIDKDTILVTSASVAEPTQVRYGYANNPACNLYNAAGLPASPFQTDGAQWPGPQAPLPVSVAENGSTGILPDARAGGAKWRFSTTGSIASDWNLASFDDGSWLYGRGGFGTEAGNIDWSSQDIWMRKAFTLDKADFDSLLLSVRHDDDVEVYLNGTLVFSESAWAGYADKVLPNEFKSVLKTGVNLIALHCRNNGGPGVVDAGLTGFHSPIPTRLHPGIAADAPSAFPRALFAGRDLTLDLRGYRIPSGSRLDVFGWDGTLRATVFPEAGKHLTLPSRLGTGVLRYLWRFPHGSARGILIHAP